MSFLTNDDYRVVTCPSDLEIICQSSEDIRRQAERTAMEEVAGYVRTRYDIDAAYSKTDIQRNPLLVQLTVSIALWWLGQWLPGMLGSEMRQTLYDNAISRLKDIQKGNFTPEFPEYPDGGDPDSGNAVSRDIQAGNFLQGYTPDNAKDGPVTAQRIWTNQPQAGGKLRINFEGRVTQADGVLLTLDSGKAARMGKETVVEHFDGTPAEIAVGDYIQGYAADPDAAELEALRVLVTIL